MNTHSLRVLGFAILVPCVGLAQTALPPSNAQAPEVNLPDPGMMQAPANGPAMPGEPLPPADAMPSQPAPEQSAASEGAQASAQGSAQAQANQQGQAPAPRRSATPAPAQASAAAQSAPTPAPAPSQSIGIAASATAASGTASAPAVIQSRPLGKGELKMNFQNASLADVLNYMSEAAGFVIVQEAPVSGTVSVVSRQPITSEDAVDLLNAVLVEKGFTAIRNGRILKIVNRSDANKKDLPVMTGSDPTQIPRKDGMVTQILPVRYLEVAKLVDNLRPLLAPDASISANESSNAILLVDTQTNVHRMAEIIRALDTSVSSVSSIRVFQLQYADSKSLATVISQLFATEQGGSNSNNPMAAFAGFGRRGGFPGFGGMGQGNGQNQGAQRAAVRVTAVADEQSNSVIVSAPEDVMTTIADVVSRIDTNIADVTETQIFRLQHADASELADVLNTLYADAGTTTNTAGGRPQGMQMGGWPGFGQQQNNNGQRSQRALLQSRVVAVPDPRTNSILISAARETMAQIAVTVGRLDSTDANKQHVFVHHLENADPDNVASILRGMFSTQGGSNTTGSQPSSSRLNQRTTTGATSDGSNILSTNGGNGSNSRTR